MDCGPKVNILLVDDNPGDVRLTIEALRENQSFNLFKCRSRWH